MKQRIKIIILCVTFLILLRDYSDAQLAAQYDSEVWTCNQVNSDRGPYTDSEGVTHPTNPLGHSEED